MEAIIRLEGVTFAYPRQHLPVLKNFNLEIAPGSFTAIIGRNGSGKSTLAKTFNALLLPTLGTVWVKGLNTADPRHTLKIRSTVGMVFQNPDQQLVYPIVEDDIAFGPENLGLDPEEIRCRVDRALEAVDMSAYRLRAPHLLSGGQRQRLAIAGVLALQPQCMVLDEPASMLDPHGRRELMKLIERLHHQGMTIILSTHCMEDAARAERILLLEQGNIIADACPADLFAQQMDLPPLDLPFAVELAQSLRQNGLNIPRDIIEPTTLVECLCQYN